MMDDSLKSVALAVSTYRSDEPVLAILRRVFDGQESPFGAVIVVDSLGSGAIAAEIQRQGWPVTYVNANENLGAAGNLALRLKTAAATQAKWCFAVNHDGRFELDQVRQLVRHGDSRQRIGAVYPTLLYSRRNQIESPKTTLEPRAKFDFDWNAVTEDCVAVAWSSSNCALYGLQPIREGVEVWGDLWIGWDDLALGWALGKNGWTQIQCRDVTITDDYEYAPTAVLGRQTFAVTKPVWYSYYQIRNLILLYRRTNGEACSLYHIFRRIAFSTGIALRGSNRRQWFKLFSSGIVAGLRGTAGKGPLP